MTGAVVHVTQDSFEHDVLDSEIPVVVDFWAPWCGPCKSIGPVLDRLAVEHAGKVGVAKVNVDEEPGIATAFQVQSIPMLVAIHGRRIVHHSVGFGGAGPLEKLFGELAARGPASLDATKPAGG